MKHPILLGTAVSYCCDAGAAEQREPAYASPRPAVRPRSGRARLPACFRQRGAGIGVSEESLGGVLPRK